MRDETNIGLSCVLGVPVRNPSSPPLPLDLMCDSEVSFNFPFAARIGSGLIDAVCPDPWILDYLHAQQIAQKGSWFSNFDFRKAMEGEFCMAKHSVTRSWSCSQVMRSFTWAG